MTIPNYLLTVCLACVSSSVLAQMILHEPFDYSVDPDASENIVGKQGGWQYGYKNDAPSQASLRDANLHAASPFPAKGTALHPTSTKTSAHKKLPESLNGKTVYFSVLMKTFPPYKGTVLHGLSGIRFRSDLGGVIFAGQVGDEAKLQIHGDSEKLGAYKPRTDYLLAGQLEISADGRKIKLSATLFDQSSPIPKSLPGKWQEDVKKEIFRDMDWNAVELHVASSSTTFDDLRISTDWSDISGK